MNITSLSIDSPEWVAFVSAHPAATAFHHPAWAELLAECYGYRPFAIAALDRGGGILAGVPLVAVSSPLTGRRWVSLPFTDACPPLCDDPNALELLVTHLAEEHRAKHIPGVEIRAWVPGAGVSRRDCSFVTHTRGLAGSAEELRRTFDRAVRQGTRQARDRGVSVRRGTSEADMMLFYDLLARTRWRLGSPVQPRRFFRLLWERVIDKGMGFALLAYAEGKPIAGDVFLSYGKTLIAKYNGSDQAYWNLRANNLLLWTAIEWGRANGYQYLDFGRTELRNATLRLYKSHWGAREEPLVYSFIGGSPVQLTQRWTMRALSTLIRHSRPSLGQVVGELLYGHYA